MNKKNGIGRLKFEFENVPIMDVRRSIRDEDDFDDMIGNLKLKLFGR